MHAGDRVAGRRLQRRAAVGATGKCAADAGGVRPPRGAQQQTPPGRRRVCAPPHRAAPLAAHATGPYRALHARRTRTQPPSRRPGARDAPPRSRSGLTKAASARSASFRALTAALPRALLRAGAVASAARPWKTADARLVMRDGCGPFRALAGPGGAAARRQPCRHAAAAPLTACGVPRDAASRAAVASRRARARRWPAGRCGLLSRRGAGLTSARPALAAPAPPALCSTIYKGVPFGAKGTRVAEVSPARRGAPHALWRARAPSFPPPKPSRTPPLTCASHLRPRPAPPGGVQHLAQRLPGDLVGPVVRRTDGLLHQRADRKHRLQ
jgi:hypothetical protein